VQFSVDGVDLGAPVPLDGNGDATSPALTTLAATGHTVSAAYVPSGGFFASNTGPDSFSIAQATLIVTAAANSKTYGQTAGDTGALSGVLNGDGITATFASPGDPATAPVGTGSYTITATLSDPNNQLSNYTVQETDATLTVNKAPLTVTANAQTILYGQPDPTLTYQITGGMPVNGDNLSGGLTRVPGENVGSYPILVGALTAGPNYSLTYVGASLTIAGITVANQGSNLVIDVLYPGEQASVQVSPGYVNVTGQGGTPVEYLPGFKAGLFGGSVLVNVGANADNLQASNSYVPGALTFSETTTLSGVGGADSWAVSNLSLAGALAVSQTAGTASLAVSNDWVGGGMTLGLAGQASSVALSSLSTQGPVAFTEAVSGAGSVSVSNCSLGTFSESLGAGSNVLSLSNDSAQQVTLTPGVDAAGVDAVLIQNASLGSLNAQLGYGNNTLSVNNASLQQLAVSVAANAAGHSGNNTVALDNLYAGSLSVAFGDGNDTLGIANASFGQATLDGGGGSNSLTVANAWFGSLSKKYF
jgi:hypothetical protein